MELKTFVNDTISYRASAFIIPNSVAKTKEYTIGKDERTAYIKKTLELNGLDASSPEEELLVQLWFHSRADLDTDNIARHGFGCMLDGEEIHLTPYNMELLPVALFKDKKEGDWIDIKVPVGLGRHPKDISDRCGVMEIHLELDQTHYRYSHCGSFDKCLSELVGYYEARH